MIKERLEALWQADKEIVLFDGICNLCNGSVQFLIRYDKKKRFFFVPLQSPLGKMLLSIYQLPEHYLESLVLLSNHQLYTYSTAALRMGEGLGGWWKVLRLFRAIPARYRDAIYKLIARNRYRLFGKKSQCMLLTPELRKRFWNKVEDIPLL